MIRDLRLKAAEIRRAVLEMGLRANSGHLAPGFSCTDILTCLYFGNVLRFDAARPDWSDRDRFVLSKGHGCMPLYAILADLGFFPAEMLHTFVQPGSVLGCHADRTLVPGIEVTAGSLGLGLAVAVGMAVGAKYDRRTHRVFVLTGDGETQEGTIWESLMYAGSNGLDNLVVIVDHNGFGATARLQDTADVRPLADKLRAFGLATIELDGHDFAALLPALHAVPFSAGSPSAIVAHTRKGAGVSFMERAYERGDPRWHYRVPRTEVEVARARADLDRAMAEASGQATPSVGGRPR